MTGILNILAGALGVAKDTYFNLVSLLLPGNGTNGAQNNTFLDGSSNNFTITRNGNTTQGTFSPFSQTGWGAYFDGSNDYVSVADNAVFDLSNQNFTVEGWFNPSALPSSGGLYYLAAQLDDSLAATSQAWQLSISNSSGTYTLSADLISGSTGYAVSGTFAFAVGTWYHIAFIRTTSGVTRLFVNGNQVGSDGSANVTVNNSPTAVTIGCRLLSGSPQSGRVFNGYISNFRLTVGAALYTSAFTPSTVPLTTTSQGASASQVELLTLQNNRFVDNSSNGFTVTPNNGAAITPFSPFAPTQAYSAAAVGGSGYFDGTGDYLTAAGNAAFDFGSGDFTVEGWIYVNSFASNFNIIGTWAASPNRGWFLYFDTALGIAMAFSTTGSNAIDVSSSYTPPANSWNHIAVVRSGSNLYIYVNGVQRGSTYNISTSSIYGNTQTLYIGERGSNLGTPITGYMSNFRIVKGTAITPPSGGPTSLLTAVSGTSLLLNFTNAGVVDATAKNVLETVGNAQISTTQSKWGGGSILFDGTGDYLQLPASNIYAFGTGDFTIECWVRFSSTTVSSGQGICQFDTAYLNSTTNGPAFGTNHPSGKWAMYVGATSYEASTLIPAINTWYHVALVRYSGTTKLYVDGTAVTGLSQADTNNYTREYLTVGGWYSTSYLLNGYIDDFRVSRFARYTANFTAPTAPFPVQ